MDETLTAPRTRARMLELMFPKGSINNVSLR